MFFLAETVVIVGVVVVDVAVVVVGSVEVKWRLDRDKQKVEPVERRLLVARRRSNRFFQRVKNSNCPRAGSVGCSTEMSTALIIT